MNGWLPGLSKLDASAPCELCGSLAGRKLSHIIPKFVFKHASVRSPTGYLRTNYVPDRRMQDGPKEHLLCRNCEQRLAAWEKPFSQIFKAQHQNPGQTFSYRGDHALAALSILWRVLTHARAHPESNHLTFGSDYSRTDSAFETWRRVLLGEMENPGKFRIFWLWPDNFTSGPKDINKYVFHACDFDIWASSNRSFSVAHLPGLFLIGALEDFQRGEFRGLDISFKGGRYLGLENKVAPFWLKNYISQKMEARQEALDGISERQNSKIQDAVLRDPQRLVESPLFRSMLHDRNINADEY